MLIKSKINVIAWIVFFLLVSFGCSTKRNTAATRAYHELTTRYNVFFNAEMAYEDALQNIYDSHKDNYNELLTMYPNSSIPGDTIEKKPGGAFDYVIEKTTKAIQEHSISAKPVRDASRMDNQDYREWLQQSEFNPFIDQAWLLMGKAHVQNGDYAQAVSVLSHTTRLFSHDIDVVSEAQLWLLRAYAEMEWYSDAETIASTLNVRPLPNDLRKLFNEFYAFYLLRRGRYGDTVPFLVETVRDKKDKVQKMRLRFLLGQLYALLGENEKAYKEFDKLRGITVSHDIELNAVLAQSGVTNDVSHTIRTLEKMAKRPKNINYADQIYYSIGNVYIQNDARDNALKSYRIAEEKSVQGGLYKAYAQIAQADIYFADSKYIYAAPKYGEGVGQFPKTNIHYNEIKLRADVLGEMLPFLKNIHEQDSLQHLAQLPQEEQLRIINAHIAMLKKKERADKREELIRGMDVSVLDSDIGSAMLPIGSGTDFYFYNPQRVAQGKSEFKRIWGDRKAEDNWRLSDKSNLASIATGGEPSETTEQKTVVSADSTSASGTKSDIYSPDYYLSQLPISADALNKSNEIIAEALFNVGNLSKDKLHDYDFAIDSYSRYLNDFSDAEHRLDVYNQLYLIYLRIDNTANAEYYKSKILTEYPESLIAQKIANPDYEYIINNYAHVQEQLYKDMLESYKEGSYLEVQENYETASTFFEHSNYMPQFKLLNALSFAQAADSVKLKLELEAISAEYAEMPQGELAQNILTGLSEGKVLASAASAISDFDWSGSYESSSLVSTDTLYFDSSAEQPYSYLLIFDDRSMDKNKLLFAVSDYNYSTFQKRLFPVSFINIQRWSGLRIDGFESLHAVNRYAELIESDSLFAHSIPDSLRTLKISNANMDMLREGKPMEEYLAFYNSVLNQSSSVIYKLEETAAAYLPEFGQQDIDMEVPVDVETTKDIKQITPLEKMPVYAPKESEQKTISERQAELERKESEALSSEESGVSAKDQRATLKEREKARKEMMKERERLLKQKERERKAELKRREQERKQKLKEQERLRKEKLKERNRALKKQNR